MPRLLHDGGLCVGCHDCELICAVVNRGANNPKKGAIRIRPRFPEPEFHAAVCEQCGVCAEVCPVEAIENRDGVYVIDEEKCTGCYSCVEACPLDVMFTHSDLEPPFKCILCGECVAICPRSALSIG